MARAILLSLLLIAVASLYLSPTPYVVRTWNRSDGLPQDTVYCLCQARNGCLWIGTDGGLARFDGFQFSTFQRFNAPFSESTTVTGIIEDKSGALWITTFGSGLLRWQAGAFTRFDRSSGLASDYLWCLLQDRRGTLWIGTIGAGLLRFENGVWSTCTREQGLPDNTVKSLLEDDLGTLWVGTESGLARSQGDRFQAMPAEPAGPSLHVLSLAQDGDRRLWIGTTFGLYCHEQGNLFRWPGQNRGQREIIRAILPRARALPWLATEGGLKAVSKDGISPLSGLDSLSDSTLMCLLCDREGAFWLGTSGNGLCRLDESPARLYTTRDGLSSDYALGIAADQDGIWVGTYGSGLNRISGDRCRSYPAMANAIVYAIAPVGTESAWLGTDQGLLRLHRGVATPLDRREKRESEAVISLLPAADGALWIGTYGSGLRVLRPGKEAAPFPPGGQPFGRTILALHQDRQGAIWVGTFQHGLGRIKNEAWLLYGKEEGLARSTIYCIADDAEGRLWLGTENGLGVLQNGRFRFLTSEHGLWGSTIYHIIDDESGRLWLSGNQGIFYLAKQQVADLLAGRSHRLDCLEIGREQGLQSTVCTGGFQPAGARDQKGHLWLPTMKGVVTIDPSRVVLPAPRYPLELEQISVDGRLYAPGEPIQLPPGRYRLGFRFILPTFEYVGHVSFRTRLEGHDRGWGLPGSDRSVVYTELSHGRYRFQVEAFFLGKAIGRASSPWLEIRPRLQETLWFFLLLPFLLAIAAMLALRLLQKRRMELRDRKATLSFGKTLAYRQRLEELMEREKPHLDPELTLVALAQKLGIPPKHLSWMIHDSFGQNFNEFINRYRVDEAIRLMRDPAQAESKLLKIAFDSGFNSKSVFNEAFKKTTGVNPSRFRQDLREVRADE